MTGKETVEKEPSDYAFLIKGDAQLLSDSSPLTYKAGTDQ